MTSEAGMAGIGTRFHLLLTTKDGPRRVTLTADLEEAIYPPVGSLVCLWDGPNDAYARQVHSVITAPTHDPAITVFCDSAIVDVPELERLTTRAIANGWHADTYPAGPVRKGD
jgi:hypothetical protein